MKLKSLIKVLLSISMLGLVLSATDFQKLKETIAGLPFSLVLLIFLGYCLGQLLSSFKWWIIAKSGGIDVSYLTALKSYFIGMFVNCFGFGVVGGDVTRGLLLSHGKPQKTPAIASVIADRLHGLAILSLLCMISFLLVDKDNLDPWLKMLLACVIAAVIIGWFIGPYLLLKIVPKDSKHRRKVEQLCNVFPSSPKVLFVISVLSLIFHLLQIYLHWLMAYAFGVYLTWQVLLTRVPIVNILTTLPISWNGLGVREKGYTYYLTPHFITQEQAVAFGAIWLLIVTLSSAIGGIVSILTKDFETITHIEKSADFSELQKEEAVN